MKTCYASLLRFLCLEDGIASVEYAVLLSLIVVAVSMAVQALGTSAKENCTQANAAFVSGKSSGQSNSPSQGNGNVGGNNNNRSNSSSKVAGNRRSNGNDGGNGNRRRNGHDNHG